MYFRVLSEKPVENKLKIMLSYLPLLRVQAHNYDLNESLKKAYQDQFQDVFKHCFRNKMCLTECYELSMLASLHPIFDSTQQTNFKAWIQLFETSLLKMSWSTSASSSLAAVHSQQNNKHSVLFPGYSRLAGHSYSYIFYSILYLNLNLNIAMIICIKKKPRSIPIIIRCKTTTTTTTTTWTAPPRTA